MIPAIELKDISIVRDNKKILSGVNLLVNEGDFLYIIGQTGSGKSSLLKTLYAELPLEYGEGTVVGYNLKTILRHDIPYLRRKMGIIFQDFQLLTDRSIYNNLSFVLKATGWIDTDKIDERIDEVLTDVGLHESKSKMPHELSGGEQQRIAIARAILNEPQLIIADEPTGNLDPQTSEGVLKTLWKISQKGKTVIIATHNYNMIKKFYSRIVKCEEGKLKEVVIKNTDR